MRPPSEQDTLPEPPGLILTLWLSHFEYYSPIHSRAKDCYYRSGAKGCACGFAEGEERLFGVNSSPNSLVMKMAM